MPRNQSPGINSRAESQSRLKPAIVKLVFGSEKTERVITALLSQSDPHWKADDDGESDSGWEEDEDDDMPF